MQAFSVKLLVNEAATSAAFQWPGGVGVFMVKATGYGTVSLQFLLPDNATWATPSGGAMTADGGFIFELPPCNIRAAVATATAVYATAARRTE